MEVRNVGVDMVDQHVVAEQLRALRGDRPNPADSELRALEPQATCQKEKSLRSEHGGFTYRVTEFSTGSMCYLCKESGA